MREVLDGVPIIRLAHYPNHSASGWKRFTSYTSFSLMASMLGPSLVRRPDVVHVYQGPTTLCLPAMLFSAFFKAPYVLDVADIWPDSVNASGMLTFRGGAAVLDFWCNLTYRLAGKVIVPSEGHRTTLLKRGVRSDKIEVVYHWCDESKMLKEKSDTQAAYEFGMSGKFNIVFAGNMGKVQALDSVLIAANNLKNDLPHVQFVFVGDGVELDHLKEFASRLTIGNVIFIPRQPIERIGRILSAADALLIHLKDGPLSRIAIPQKTQAYMAVGRPIIMAVYGDSADLVRRAEAGLVCEPESPEAITNAVRALLQMTPQERQTFGSKGRSFYNQELSFAVGVRQMVSIFEDAIACVK